MAAPGAASRCRRRCNAASARTLAISLASTGSGTLRVRLVGPNVALRDRGCYPVATVRVEPQIKEYAVPIASFGPEAYCGADAPAGVVVAATLSAIEVPMPSWTPGAGVRSISRSARSACCADAMCRRPLVLAARAALFASPVLLASPARGGDTWVRFDDASRLVSARPIVASEVPGDATLAALSEDDGMLRVEGELGRARGGRWATLGAEMAPEAVEAGADLSRGAMLRIGPRVGRRTPAARARQGW